MKTTDYVAKTLSSNGHIEWQAEEHDVWGELLTRQNGIIEQIACTEYLDGLAKLALPQDRIPQLSDIDAVLLKETGWRTAPVPALINFDKFFALLASKAFPVATFIRRREQMDYLQEPDIFHEIYGHCPLLTHPAFAHFTHTYGQAGLNATPEERVYLARLYWFTVEFGLLQTSQGLKIYGGGILSSPSECDYAMHSDAPKRSRFDLNQVLRTPYQIDVLQPQYFYLDSLDDLFDFTREQVMEMMYIAKREGLLSPV